MINEVFIVAKCQRIDDTLTGLSNHQSPVTITMLHRKIDSGRRHFSCTMVELSLRSVCQQGLRFL